MTIEVFAKLVADERERQEEKFPGRTCASDGMTDTERLTVLVEEVGEVAQVLNDGGSGYGIQEELVQIAAVCAAWLSHLVPDAIEACLGCAFCDDEERVGEDGFVQHWTCDTCNSKWDCCCQIVQIVKTV